MNDFRLVLTLIIVLAAALLTLVGAIAGSSIRIGLFLLSTIALFGLFIAKRRGQTRVVTLAPPQ